MPELPEVETIRRSLGGIEGSCIRAVSASGASLRRSVPLAELESAVGKRITRTSRLGKYLLLHLSDGSCLVFHFGMSGTLLLRPALAPLQEHEHVAFALEPRGALVLHDPRRFGLVRVIARGEWPSELTMLGPDAWHGSYSAEDLFAHSRGRRASVKAWLMDQRTLAGLGNIYACEALHLAGIRPGRAAGRLTRAEVARLHRAIRTTLAEAIAAGGSSIADFRDSNGKPGYFQHRFRVYDRAGEPCRACGTTIRQRVLAGRSTFYCPRCQR